jgi:hypothetical protein
VLIFNYVPEESKIAVMARELQGLSLSRGGFVGSVMNCLCVLLLAFSVSERYAHVGRLFCPVQSGKVMRWLDPDSFRPLFVLPSMSPNGDTEGEAGSRKSDLSP